VAITGLALGRGRATGGGRGLMALPWGILA
jgi:hypothetical protein